MKPARIIYRSHAEYEVVIGPCPGCDNWQIDYTYGAASHFGSPLAFELAIEDALLEHATLECPRLVDVLTHRSNSERVGP